MIKYISIILQSPEGGRSAPGSFWGKKTKRITAPLVARHWYLDAAVSHYIAGQSP